MMIIIRALRLSTAWRAFFGLILQSVGDRSCKVSEVGPVNPAKCRWNVQDSCP